MEASRCTSPETRVLATSHGRQLRGVGAARCRGRCSHGHGGPLTEGHQGCCVNLPCEVQLCILFALRLAHTLRWTRKESTREGVEGTEEGVFTRAQSGGVCCGGRGGRK